MDNLYQIPHQQQQVPNDEFLNMLNFSNHIPYQQQDHYYNQINEEEFEVNKFLAQNEKKGMNQEKLWMFGDNQFEMKFEESPPEINNPFYEHQVQRIPMSVQRNQRSDSFFGTQLMDLVSQQQDNKSISNKKEQEIILNNRELFQANQSKSIYLSKISTLIEKSLSPNLRIGSPNSPTSQSKILEKIQRKISNGQLSNGQQDSESSSEDSIIYQILQENELQLKLAKNRESARNSRRRKKVYVELLENKVQDLSGQISKLEALCANQKSYIEHCQNAHLKVQHLFCQELQIMDDLGNAVKYKQPTEPVLCMIESSIGVASIARTGACDYFMDGLLGILQNNITKFFCESAEQCSGLFNQSGLINTDMLSLQQLFIKEYGELKHGIQQFQKQFEALRNQALKLEMVERQILQIIPASQYTQQIMCINANLTQKYEYQDISIQSMMDEKAGNKSLRKHIKTL